jgi:hypothetical protein
MQLLHCSFWQDCQVLQDLPNMIQVLLHKTSKINLPVLWCTENAVPVQVLTLCTIYIGLNYIIKGNFVDVTPVLSTLGGNMSVQIKPHFIKRRSQLRVNLTFMNWLQN